MEDFRARQLGPDAGRSNWPHDNLNLRAALFLSIIFKGVPSFQFLKLAFLIFFFFFLVLLCTYCMACGILVPRAGTELGPPALEAQSLTTGRPGISPLFFDYNNVRNSENVRY